MMMKTWDGLLEACNEREKVMAFEATLAILILILILWSVDICPQIFMS